MTRRRRAGGVALITSAGLTAGSIVLGIHLADPRAHPAPHARPTAGGQPTARAPTPPVGMAPAAPLVKPTTDQVPAPVRVRVPALGIDSGLEALHTDAAGRLLAPREWLRAGWFADGARPGAVGPAVIAGHIDSPSGAAVFVRLSELRPGQLVEVVQRGGSTATFRVDRTQVAAKASFPTRAVYGPTPDPQLRLITCDGPFVESAGGYRDNLIIFATLVS